MAPPWPSPCRQRNRVGRLPQGPPMGGRLEGEREASWRPAPHPSNLGPSLAGVLHHGGLLAHTRKPWASALFYARNHLRSCPSQTSNSSNFTETHQCASFLLPSPWWGLQRKQQGTAVNHTPAGIQEHDKSTDTDRFY